MTQPLPPNNPMYRTSIFPNAVDQITNENPEIADAIMAMQQAVLGGGAAGTGITNVTATGTLTGGSVVTVGSVTVGNSAIAGPKLWGGVGAPAAGLGANGDFYFRSDGAANTHIYNKAAGTWTGII